MNKMVAVSVLIYHVISMTECIYLCVFVYLCLCVCVQMFSSPHQIHLMYRQKKTKKIIHNKKYSTVDS